MSFLAHIAACNRHDLSNFRPFVVAGRRVGWIKPGFAARLAEFPETFKVDADSVTLDPALDDFDTRSKAVDRVLRRLAAAGVIPGWRHEAYSVGASFDAPPLMKMERAAVPAFGIRACGVHMNGFVRKNGALHMWVPRRSRDRPTYPGLFDNLVAGGLAHGLSPRQCLVKECGEEAGIPPALAARAVAVGTLSYTMETADGLKPDLQYLFDLELPEDFAPHGEDGEHEAFFLWPIEDVAARVRDTQDFKFNCNLVIIDFLIRHGRIGPEHPDYLALCDGLRRGAA